MIHVSEEKPPTPKTSTGVKWTQVSTMRPLSEEPRCSSNVPFASANYTLQLNVTWLRLPAQHHKRDHQDDTQGKENRSRYACCTMTGRETDAHMPQTASTATPVRSAKDDIPTLSVQTDARTPIHLEVTQTQGGSGRPEAIHHHIRAKDTNKPT